MTMLPQSHATPHETMCQTMQQVIDSLILGDWQHLQKGELEAASTRLRSFKAMYIHSQKGVPIQFEFLSQIDQMLIEMYLVLDDLEGKDVHQRRRFYDALMLTQYALLQGVASLQTVCTRDPYEAPENRLEAISQNRQVAENER